MVVGLVAGLGAAGSTMAAPVNCPSLPLGGGDNRYMIVNPGAGGCYSQSGNLQQQDLENIAAGAEFIEKDDLPGGSGSGVLTWTYAGATHSGTFSLASSLWDDYERIFVAFHWGNASGGPDAADPDSFAVELSAFQTGGSFSLISAGGRLTGLSWIALIGVPCAPDDPLCNEGEEDVPEPGTLLLIGIGALGLALRRRMKA